MVYVISPDIFPQKNDVNGITRRGRWYARVESNIRPLTIIRGDTSSKCAHLKWIKLIEYA